MKINNNLILNLEEELVKMDIDINNVSLEDGFISNILDSAKNVFGSLTKKVTTIQSTNVKNRTFIQKLLDERGELHLVNFIRKENKVASKTIEDVNFMTVEDRTIMTITGLNVRMIMVSNALVGFMEKASKNNETIMNNIDDRIARFIGNPEVRKSFRKPNNAVEEAIKFNKETMEFLEKSFDKTKLEETNSFKNLFGNNNEYVRVIENLVKSNEVFTEKQLLNISLTVSKINERVTVLHEILEQGEVVVSKESLQGLVSALDAVANYVTIISNLYYLNTKMIEVVMQAKKIYEES